jgi:hypothetical protein
MLKKKLSYYTYALPTGPHSLINVYAHGGETSIFNDFSLQHMPFPLRVTSKAVYGFVSPDDHMSGMTFTNPQDGKFFASLPTFVEVRLDYWNISPAVFKAEVNKSTRDWMFQHQASKVPADVKSAIKDAVTQSLRSKSAPAMRVVTASFDFSDQDSPVLRVFTASKSVANGVADFIGSCFGVEPVLVTFQHRCAKASWSCNGSALGHLSSAATLASTHDNLHSLCMDTTVSQPWNSLRNDFGWWLMALSRAQNYPITIRHSITQSAAEVYVGRLNSAQLVNNSVSVSAKGEVNEMDRHHLMAYTAINGLQFTVEVHATNDDGSTFSQVYAVKFAAGSDAVHVSEVPAKKPQKQDAADGYRTYSVDVHEGMRGFENVFNSMIAEFLVCRTNTPVWDKTTMLDID